MDKTFRIIVTQEDLDIGCRGNATECAVARAGARAVNREVVVGFYVPNGKDAGLYMLWKTDSGRYFTRLPQEVSQLVIDFDSGDTKLKPLEFEVTPELHDYTKD